MAKAKAYDAVVIGAGLLGTFAARALSQKAMDICVVEKASDVCTGISKANAAIVYSGYDVPPNTLKSRLCVPGCESFPALCEELGVRFRQCGSLLVCFGPVGEADIREKYEQGLKNSVPGLRLVDRNEILSMEPHIRRDVTLGLYAPHAGTVEPWELGIAAYENARVNGVDFRLNTEVLSIAREEPLYLIKTDRGELRARSVINCAGLRAAEVRDTILPPKIDIRSSVSDLAVFAPESRNYVNHVIFSQSEDGSKGVTLIPTVDGKVMAESPRKEKTQGESAISTMEGQRALKELAGELIPELQNTPILRYFAAIRPNPFDVNDRKRHIGGFSLLEEDGFLSLIGIKTPGMTCAEGLGQVVSEKISSYLGISDCNPHFCPRREAPVRLADLNAAGRSKMIEKDPRYGSIVCRCGGISEGEVLDAIHAGARTLDGVKRRCGTALGLCQGGFCTAEVAKLLSRELGISVEEVLYAHD